MKLSARYLRFPRLTLASTVIALLWMTMAAAVLATEERQTTSSVEPLYRAHRFNSSPKLNPKTTFRIRELDVPKLWPELRLQLFEAEDMVDGQAFAKRQFLYRGGVIHRFVESFGGHGAMSAVVHGNALYYSYSWGSGIHRSVVGRLTIQHDTPVQQETQPLFHADMFVDMAEDGRVRVVEAKWRGFNQWEGARLLGWIDAGEQTRLRIVDDEGREVLLRQ